jgi:glycosidase
MGYPFRNALIGWLTQDISKDDMINRFESLRENYPPEAYYCTMNLISSHDILRAITAIAGEKNVVHRSEQAHHKLDEKQRYYGETLLKLAMLIQMTIPGAPSIYYGDEIAMEGYLDPFNRRPFRWDLANSNNNSFLEWVKSLLEYRNRHLVFKTGWIEYLEADDQVLMYRRFFTNEENALGKKVLTEPDQLVLINMNPFSKTVYSSGIEIEMRGYSGVIVSEGIRTHET